MAQQHLNTGSNNSDGTGDTLRRAFIKTEGNFNELYTIASTYPFPYTGEVEIDGDLQTTTSITSTQLTASVINATDNVIPRKQFVSITNSDSYILMQGTGTTSFLIDTYSKKYTLNLGNTSITYHASQIFPLTSNFYRIKGSLTSNLLYVKNQSPYNFGIGTNITTHKLTVNGAISSSEYLGTLPTSDPNVIGQWFTTSSNEVFGDGLETQIICISQG